MPDLIQGVKDIVDRYDEPEEPSTTESGEGEDGGLEGALDLEGARGELEAFREEASEPVALSGNAAGIVSAAKSAMASVKSMFSTPLTIKAQVETEGDGDGDGGDGRAVGFDMIMAELLLRLRDEEKQEIRIISVIPFPSWRAKWSSEEIRRQNMILEKSDEVIFVRQHYCQGIYMIRNRALADGSQVCIAYCNRPKGGTAWTVRYAKQNGLQTYNLAGGEGK